MKKGLVIVISAPSGAGKTTVIREFLKSHKQDFVISVSATTRKPRKGERNGRDYFFLSKRRFRELVKKGSFLEYARVLSNYYGTMKKTVLTHINKGKNVIMDIDVQGAAKIRRSMGKDCVTVFLMPPSFAELKKRLQNRRTEPQKEVKKRLNLAKKELKEKDKYDYIVVNKDLKKAALELEKIYRKESEKRIA
ncbi:MAG TPA: guanylate kinase [Candidatus Goldiibacteriota bacterium]|nr:guanylate kinase [Candidatus Goldiibacteriota bacterium]